MQSAPPAASAAGADVAADVAIVAGGLAGQLRRAAADLGHLGIEAGRLEPRPGAAKGGGEDELRTGLEVGAVQL
jgi:hypothetical protein